MEGMNGIAGTEGLVMRSMILGCLYVGFLLLLRRIQWLEILRQLMKQTRDTMDEAARQRMLQNRKILQTMQDGHSLWMRLEQELQYSGLKRSFPFLTAENWFVGNVVFLAMVFLVLLVLTPRWWMPLCAVGIVLGVESLLFMLAKARAMQSVDQNLLKFLDFLGNYSITAGEVTGVFNQISRYVEEPLKSALDQCYYEAQTTGDAGLALLSMAEKIEHPKFKELVRNMEISIRYCADFTALVNSSRRSVREYLRTGGERKSMLREASVNMFLLLGLSCVILLTVDGLIEVSMWQVLFFTMPGRIALGVLGVIFLLFAGQIYRINR